MSTDPSLLLRRSVATDYSGRTYKGTPFQIALLIHDVTLWKKIKPYFDTFTEGPAEKARQFMKLFPNGIPEQKPYDFNSLTQAISNSSDTDIQEVLRKENTDTLICKALNNFRKSFTNLAMFEAFFNPFHLIKASEVYDLQFPNWSNNQRDLFWRQVIGFIQRFMPACFAQAFCQGLYYIVEGKKRSRVH